MCARLTSSKLSSPMTSCCCKGGPFSESLERRGSTEHTLSQNLLQRYRERERERERERGPHCPLFSYPTYTTNILVLINLHSVCLYRGQILLSSVSLLDFIGFIQNHKIPFGVCFCQTEEGKENFWTPIIVENNVSFYLYSRYEYCEENISILSLDFRLFLGTMFLYSTKLDL